HRALHSFPTRRSSDLPHSSFALERALQRVRVCSDGAAKHGTCQSYIRAQPRSAVDARWHTVRRAAVAFQNACGGAAFAPMATSTDRKSTRLNSSHVKN